MSRLLGVLLATLALGRHPACAQVIEFESNGLKFQTLTRSGVTVMFAQLPTHIHEYAIVQVAVSNGAPSPYFIRPEDFTFVRGDGTELHATPARTVVAMLTQKGSGNDVIKLVTTYEASLYGNAHFKSTNGYEQRRQAALAMTATRLKAAAAASAGAGADQNGARRHHRWRGVFRDRGQTAGTRTYAGAHQYGRVRIHHRRAAGVKAHRAAANRSWGAPWVRRLPEGAV